MRNQILSIFARRLCMIFSLNNKKCYFIKSLQSTNINLWHLKVIFYHNQIFSFKDFIWFWYVFFFLFKYLLTLNDLHQFLSQLISVNMTLLSYVVTKPKWMSEESYFLWKFTLNSFVPEEFSFIDIIVIWFRIRFL